MAIQRVIISKKKKILNAFKKFLTNGGWILLTIVALRILVYVSSQ